MRLAKGVDLMMRVNLFRVSYCWLAGTAFVASFAMVEPVAAQPSGICTDTASARSRQYRNIYTSLVSRTDTASARRRSQVQLPFLQANQVRLVADTAVCRAASTALDGVQGISLPEISVLVVELGPSHRIVIKDLGFSHWWLNFLFNSDFSQILGRIWL